MDLAELDEDSEDELLDGPEPEAAGAEGEEETEDDPASVLVVVARESLR
ncbi:MULTISPECIES: hypothetical protein [Arthrobacter]|nr:MULTISPECIES: hypothetical protein [Arthrobacter]